MFWLVVVFLFILKNHIVRCGSFSSSRSTYIVTKRSMISINLVLLMSLPNLKVLVSSQNFKFYQQIKSREIP